MIIIRRHGNIEDMDIAHREDRQVSSHLLMHVKEIQTTSFATYPNRMHRSSLGGRIRAIPPTCQERPRIAHTSRNHDGQALMFAQPSNNKVAQPTPRPSKRNHYRRAEPQASRYPTRTHAPNSNTIRNWSFEKRHFLAHNNKSYMFMMNV